MPNATEDTHSRTEEKKSSEAEKLVLHAAQLHLTIVHGESNKISRKRRKDLYKGSEVQNSFEVMRNTKKKEAGWTTECIDVYIYIYIINISI